MLKSQSSCTECVLLLAMFIIACQGAPQAVLDAAISEAQTSCISFTRDANGCRDFKAARSAERGLTNADKANGMESAWCVRVTYLTKSDL